jgi:D-arabinose 1-dehydrogenase-like Zn-dependent alcohol dehydrogenase
MIQTMPLESAAEAHQKMITGEARYRTALTTTT